MAKYEEYIKKLKELVDKDKAEDLIDELSASDEQRVELIQIKKEIATLKKECMKSKKLRF